MSLKVKSFFSFCQFFIFCALFSWLFYKNMLSYTSELFFPALLYARYFPFIPVNLIRRNISPFGEYTRQGEYAKHKFQKIRRNIEAVTTRRSWKPFAQKARGFESLFLRHKNEHHPSWMVFIFISQSEGTNPKGSHTAGTEHTTRNRLFAVSASQGDVGLNFILKRND